MNGKTASIAAGVTGTILFGAFLAHNQSFDLQRKKAPDVVQSSYVETKKDDKSEKYSKKTVPVLIAMDTTSDPQVQPPSNAQPQQPSNTPPPAATNKKATKTRAS
jgi:hypothetical protein